MSDYNLRERSIRTCGNDKPSTHTTTSDTSLHHVGESVQFRNLTMDAKLDLIMEQLGNLQPLPAQVSEINERSENLAECEK